MDEINILEQLFDNKVLSILKLFIKDESSKYYLREISKLTKISPASTYRILKKLVDLKILELVRIKNTKLYQLNNENNNTEFLKSILKIKTRVIDLFVENIKNTEAVNEVILHGEEKDNRANLLLIGENINQGEIKRVCAEIKEKYNFTISTLQLAREQFEQMSAMGLYPGKRKVLFSR
ncbi:winged helix-turn-helix transcriptional regulator [Candidatus Woesearchaeota archaeon]|nr:winged helix-turn-helix transcriptional regulator [Candidatus Woesearchaeota archaeon]